MDGKWRKAEGHIDTDKVDGKWSKAEGQTERQTKWMESGGRHKDRETDKVDGDKVDEYRGSDRQTR